MSNLRDKTGRPGGMSGAVARVSVLVCCGALIIAATLLTSSLVDQGHGLLGISVGVSAAILVSFAAAAMAVMGKVVWKAMAQGHHKDALSGLKRARLKGDLVTDEWFKMLNDAKIEFYLAGHSLGKWCSPTNKARFRGELSRILVEGGHVTLVMLGPGSPQLAPLQLATGTDYRGRIHESIRFLNDFERSLDPKTRLRFRVSTLEDDGPLPYMVVGNERRLLTATYLARTDSEAMPCLELERTSEPGRAIYDDFRKLAEEGNGRGLGDDSTDVRQAQGIVNRLFGRAPQRNRF